MKLTLGGTNNWVMFVLSLGKSLMRQQLVHLLLDNNNILKKLFFLPPVKAKEKQNTIPTNCASVYSFWSTRVHISYPTLAYMRWTPRPNAAPEGAAVEFRSQVHLYHISGGIFPDAYFVLVTLLYPILVPESSAGHVKAGSRGFLTERSSFTRCSLLFPPLLAGFNVVDVDFHFNLTVCLKLTWISNNVKSFLNFPRTFFFFFFKKMLLRKLYIYFFLFLYFLLTFPTLRPCF